MNNIHVTHHKLNQNFYIPIYITHTVADTNIGTASNDMPFCTVLPS